MPVSTGLPAQLWAVRLLFARQGFVGLDEVSLIVLMYVRSYFHLRGMDPRTYVCG